jgi:polyferredoxin
MPSWKHRRRLIYASFFLSVAMIVFGAITWRTDTGVAQQLIIGGVALITIILTAYTAFATYEDVKVHRSENNDYLEP